MSVNNSLILLWMQTFGTEGKGKIPSPPGIRPKDWAFCLSEPKAVLMPHPKRQPLLIAVTTTC